MSCRIIILLYVHRRIIRHGRTVGLTQVHAYSTQFRPNGKYDDSDDAIPVIARHASKVSNLYHMEYICKLMRNDGVGCLQADEKPLCTAVPHCFARYVERAASSHSASPRPCHEVSRQQVSAGLRQKLLSTTHQPPLTRAVQLN